MCWNESKRMVVCETATVTGPSHNLSSSILMILDHFVTTSFPLWFSWWSPGQIGRIFYLAIFSQCTVGIGHVTPVAFICNPIGIYRIYDSMPSRWKDFNYLLRVQKWFKMELSFVTWPVESHSKGQCCKKRLFIITASWNKYIVWSGDEYKLWVMSSRIIQFSSLNYATKSDFINCLVSRNLWNTRHNIETSHSLGCIISQWVYWETGLVFVRYTHGRVTCCA